jgi:hypothetical protein
MTQRQLTIDLPESAKVLHHVLQVLLKYDLISEEKARTLEQERRARKPMSRWVLAAERFDSEGFLDGKSDRVKEYIRDFRDGFNL